MKNIQAQSDYQTVSISCAPDSDIRRATWDRLRATLNGTNDAYFERAAVVRSIACAFIAREHVLILGSPGTAKTDLVSAVATKFLGDPDAAFEVLLTKFSTPEDVFGPIDLDAYHHERRYVRITDGRAWDRKVVVLDEVFKASSSIMNAMLKMMQSRKADNGGSVAIPLEVVFGLSNEYPEDPQLGAFFDRFLFRHWVDYIADPANFKAMLRSVATCGNPVDGIPSMEPGDIYVLRAWADAVPFGQFEEDRLSAVKAAVEQEGFRPSDRTWAKCIKVLRASAVVDGRDRIEARDYRALADVLWSRHEDRPRLLQTIGNAADPYGSKADAIQDAIKLALRELPDLSLLRSGKMRKTEIIAAVAKVSQRVCAELDKAREVFDASGSDSNVGAAVEAAEAAIAHIDRVSREAIMYRESK